ncbi:hypothetical protein [Marinobacterium aestuariivivens]|uniref:Uncharacterized protein n=1 Tax=Marinobacterium aestuariivivens TaxID=1698799 RepID=A0ABW2A805_9GAMM
MSDHDAYGLWMLGLFNSAISIFFAFSFTKPRTRLDWRSLGGFSAYILIMLGLLLQWPTILILIMFPALVVVYIRLARREEAPAFFPRLRGRSSMASRH